jgi:hypothetical protein
VTIEVVAAASIVSLLVVEHPSSMPYKFISFSEVEDRLLSDNEKVLGCMPPILSSKHEYNLWFHCGLWGRKRGGTKSKIWIWKIKKKVLFYEK